jgi:hypothetical protein
MIDAFFNNADWFWSLLLVVPYLSKLSTFVRLLGVLGPLAPIAQLLLEKSAKVISTVVLYLLKSLWHCLFNPITWGAVFLFWGLGPYVTPFDAMRAANKAQQTITERVAHHTAHRRAPRRYRVSRHARSADTRALFLRNFDQH